MLLGASTAQQRMTRGAWAADFAAMGVWGLPWLSWGAGGPCVMLDAAMRAAVGRKETKVAAKDC